MKQEKIYKAEDKEQKRKEREKKRELYEIHEKECIRMFNKAFKGQELYIHVDEIDEISETIRFGILTDSIINYDRLRRETEGYRPFFFSFVSNYNQKIKSFLEKEDLQETNSNWFLATFDTENDNLESLITIEGTAEYAASPIVSNRKTLKIIDRRLPRGVLQDINATYALPTFTDSVVIDKFCNTFANIKFEYADIFKAGHANVIRLRGRESGQFVSVVFDIGKHGGYVGSSPRNYPKTNAAIKRMKPKAVILSHWDMDHILGVIEASNDMFECMWFAPEILKGTGAKRLACYLHHKGNLVLVNRRCADGLIADISGFSMYMGRDPGGNISIRENWSGIVLNYTYGDVSTVFCGDAPYEALTNTLWTLEQIHDYIIIPHHARPAKVKGIVTPNPKGGYAIYCRNDDGDPTHIGELHNDCNYEIYKTEDVSNLYYTINLRRLEPPTAY